MSLLVGNTPLVRLARFSRKYCHDAPLYAKLEFFSCSGSVKDRAALFMIDNAQRQGYLRGGGTIVEPTSGNTGIALATIAAARDYRAVLTMPSNANPQRQQLLRALGASVVLTNASEGMQGAILAAKQIVSSTANSFMPSQFDNPFNAAAHFATTGPEIWNALEHGVDAFFSAVGTGGTLSGTGRFLKSRNKNISVMAVEPDYSESICNAFRAAGRQNDIHNCAFAGTDGSILQEDEKMGIIAGIGAGFIPKNLDLSICDKVFSVSYANARATAAALARCEGIMAGMSSAAALCAATTFYSFCDNRHKSSVVIFADSAERTPM